MTTAEANNERATVDEFERNLRECAVEALLAGIPRDEVKAALRDLLARLEAAHASDATGSREPTRDI